MKTVWSRLIRFEATDGRILNGQPILPRGTSVDLGLITAADSIKAHVVTGDDIFDTSGKTRVTNEEVNVKRVLAPMRREDIPILRCVGLNYAKHSTSCRHGRPSWRTS
jgi:hypothetical protein